MVCLFLYLFDYFINFAFNCYLCNQCALTLWTVPRPRIWRSRARCACPLRCWKLPRVKRHAVKVFCLPPLLPFKNVVLCFLFFQISTHWHFNLWVYYYVNENVCVQHVYITNFSISGSKTWDRFEMKIHKRVIDLRAPTEVVKQITSINIEPGVEGVKRVICGDVDCEWWVICRDVVSVMVKQIVSIIIEPVLKRLYGSTDDLVMPDHINTIYMQGPHSIWPKVNLEWHLYTFFAKKTPF